MFKAFEFCIPTRGVKVPAGPEWFHEIKQHGFRLRVDVRNEAVGRHGQMNGSPRDVTADLPGGGKLSKKSNLLLQNFRVMSGSDLQRRLGSVYTVCVLHPVLLREMR